MAGEIGLVVPPVILVQILVPGIHLIVQKRWSTFRLLSIYACSFYTMWWVFGLGCLTVQCFNEEIFGAIFVMAVVWIIIWYVVMLIESCFSAEKEYLSSISPDITVTEFVQQLRTTNPRRVMSVVCYHMELRTRTVYERDANGNTYPRTETYQEMVVTYTEDKDFPIAGVVDISDLNGLVFDQCRVTRLNLTKDIQFGDQATEDKFNAMKEQMLNENKHRDQNIDFSYADVIDGFKERLCAYTDPENRPSWMKSSIFWLATLFGLTWVFRVVFRLKTSKCDFAIKKLIYITPRPSHQVPRATPMHYPSNYGPSFGNQGIHNMGMATLSFQHLNSQLQGQPVP